MKKFNLFKEIIVTNKSALLQAINSSKVFAIDVNGEIKYEPFNENEIHIYQGKHTPQQTSALMPTAKISLDTILGKNYQVVEDEDERVLIKAFSNWQEIISFNTPRASYDDTTADGVDKFSHKDIEEIGWHATEFNINYRTIVEHIEDNCSGTLICIEQEEPYQFSGLAFLDDNKVATQTVFDFCKAKIKNIMDTDDMYKKENLTDDELEAAEFFKLV